MKRYPFILAMALAFSGACAMFFASCAGNPVKNPQPPVTVLNPDPTPVPVTKKTLAFSQGHRAHSQAHRTKVHALPAALTAPAAPAPKAMAAPAVSHSLPAIAALVQQKFKDNGNDWLWLLLLLLLLALGAWLWSRFRRERALSGKTTGLTQKGSLAEFAESTPRVKHPRLSHKVLLAKVAELAQKAKRARAAYKARRARAAHEAERAQLAREGERVRLAHQALLAKRSRLAHKLILAKRARLAHRGILAKDAGSAPQVILSKAAGVPPGDFDEARAEWTTPRIPAKGPRPAHPRILAKRTGSAPRGILTKVAGAQPGMIPAKAAEPPFKGILAKGNGSDPKKALEKRAGLAEEEILVEGPGLAEVIKVSITRAARFEEIIVSVARMGNFPAKKAYIFLENEAVPLDPNHLLDVKHPRHKILHVHTQREIGVAVYFNGLEHKANFSPATTVQRVLDWAITEFKISGQDLAGAHLALQGSSESLQDTAHIGRFVPHDKNKIELDVITPRVFLTKN